MPDLLFAHLIQQEVETSELAVSFSDVKDDLPHLFSDAIKE